MVLRLRGSVYWADDRVKALVYLMAPAGLEVSNVFFVSQMMAPPLSANLRGLKWKFTITTLNSFLIRVLIYI